jgi:hypothetical protein
MGARSRASPEGGAAPAADGDAAVAVDVEHACHEIIDAASAAAVNLDLATRGTDHERNVALEEVQLAIARIVDLATEIRRTCRVSTGPTPPGEVRRARSHPRTRRGRPE